INPQSVRAVVAALNAHPDEIVVWTPEDDSLKQFEIRFILLPNLPTPEPFLLMFAAQRTAEDHWEAVYDDNAFAPLDGTRDLRRRLSHLRNRLAAGTFGSVKGRPTVRFLDATVKSLTTLDGGRTTTVTLTLEGGAEMECTLTQQGLDTLFDLRVGKEVEILVNQIEVIESIVY
ncbi:MAG TPA: hypothetical protein VNG90_02190, partial [Candidatus Acidoferrum sp.]|nr:hypothetical protein [Candidatus Acidoferrum sp.]